MKYFSKFTLTFYILGFIYGCASYTAKDNKLSATLSSTQQAITNLQEKISASTDDHLIKTFHRLEKKSKELFPTLKDCNKKYALTKEYIATLQEAQKTIKRVDKNFNNIPDKTFILDAIYQDFDAKLITINSSTEKNANTKIKVIVDSNKEEGFFVFGKLSYEKTLDIKRFRFNKPTNSATQDFVPGYYLFWLEKEDRVGEPELHLIMNSGAEEEKKLVLKTPK
ncbi:hypothetical protein [Ascidiimonas sp. W6]|uniref:hypothetical protein n=1 Tax=Ascidiimonas meishanensis TaxID=3128903 RepID=UPI0030EF6E9B